MSLNRVRELIVGLLAVSALALLGHMHVAVQSYHPVIRIADPVGLTYTALQDVTAERQSCGEANERFLAAFRKVCPQCRIEYARCERELRGLEAAMADRQPVPVHVVYAPQVKTSIEGPAAMAGEACAYLAADLVKRGFSSAVCVAPSAPQAGK